MTRTATTEHYRNIRMRLDAIRNFDTLVAFLNELPTPSQPDAYVAAIARLHFKRDKPYPIIVDLDGPTRSSAARLIEAMRGRRGYRLRDAPLDEIEILLWSLRQLHGLRSRHWGRG